MGEKGVSGGRESKKNIKKTSDLIWYNFAADSDRRYIVAGLVGIMSTEPGCLAGLCCSEAGVDTRADRPRMQGQRTATTSCDVERPQCSNAIKCR